MLSEIQVLKPELSVDFEGSVFASMTVNLGPQTVSLKHRDRLNKLTGWCGITALGKFEDCKGGHLILWDLGVVVQFPAGSTIMIPSALLYHSNTSIGDLERRYSIVQFTAGSLFQWTENGGRSQEEFESLATKSEVERMAKRHAERRQRNIECFMPLSEL